VCYFRRSCGSRAIMRTFLKRWMLMGLRDEIVI